jgi:hypothetical protein
VPFGGRWALLPALAGELLRDQETPFLNVIPLDRSVETVVAHRILPAWVDSISELANLHSHDGEWALTPFFQLAPAKGNKPAAM